ncbi:MAG: acyl carrier protein, partial [Synechococcus sp.]
MSDTLERVRTIVVDQLGVESDTVKAESHFQNDLGADSLDTVE